jgi:phosphate transport system protein
MTTRSHFQEELEGLERSALGGLDLVVQALDRALETVANQDVELASIVIADDDRIDGRYLEVHQGVLSLLALQAPVAGDLRIVAALLHVIKHVERMGDQFERRDVAMAQDLVQQDDLIDHLNREVFHHALELGDEPDRREWAMHMMLVGRCIERIGDNAVDIGEQTAFVVTGLFREFEDASHPVTAPPTA